MAIKKEKVEAKPHICSICGSPVKASGKRGRPREYCGAPCRKLAAALAQVQHFTLAIVKNSTPETRRAIRERLWTLANVVNLGGKA